MPRKSWKTTLGGVGAILTALGAGANAVANDHYDQVAALIPPLLAGFALLFARDNDKTSEEVGAKDAAIRREYTGR